MTIYTVLNIKQIHLFYTRIHLLSQTRHCQSTSMLASNEVNLLRYLYLSKKKHYLLVTK